MLVEGVYAGAAAGLVSFKKPGKIYVPLTGSITYFLKDENDKWVPFVQGDAGYGIYNNRVDVRKNVQAEMRGGFTASAGFGVKLSSNEYAALQPFASCGLSIFHLNNTYITTDNAGNMSASYGTDLIRRIALKVGIQF